MITEETIITPEILEIFGFKKDGFGSYNLSVEIHEKELRLLCFSGDYLMLRQGDKEGKRHEDDVVTLWNKDIMKVFTFGQLNALVYGITGKWLQSQHKGEIAGRWVSCGEKFPEEWTTSIIRHRHTKKLITEDNVDEAQSDYFEMKDGTDIEYWKCEWLNENESPASPSNLSNKNDLTVLRNRMYDLLPTGKVDSIDFIACIGGMFKIFDEYIDYLPSTSPSNKEDAIGFAEWQKK